MDPIRDAVIAYMEQHDDLAVVSVYLFGSRAEGRDHEQSDIDLGILLDRDRYPRGKDRFEIRLHLASDLAGLAEGGADIVLLDEAPPLLARRIVVEGERIHCDDPEKDHAFVRDIQLRAADLVPFLRRHQKTKLEQLRT